eukprot:TRINITY_DN18915_c1_g1_i1.p2 TRINITY_DN18915_c1_g1~~TRINITY_DN18915_c1_g1_i1.p2  ORF type:complete len:204 (-),score=38.55 TRINITY_DN18915_c1_g1_i1:251-862(-)
MEPLSIIPDPSASASVRDTFGGLQNCGQSVVSVSFLEAAAEVASEAASLLHAEFVMVGLAVCLYEATRRRTLVDPRRPEGKAVDVAARSTAPVAQPSLMACARRVAGQLAAGQPWSQLSKGAAELARQLRPSTASQQVLLCVELLLSVVGLLLLCWAVLAQQPEEWPEDCLTTRFDQVAACVFVFFAGALMNCSAFMGIPLIG